MANDRQNLFAHITKIFLYQVAYEKDDPAKECPTFDDLKSQRIILKKSEQAFLTILQFQTFFLGWPLL
jgi:hypothetical protein